jgi:hypothetical protein
MLKGSRAGSLGGSNPPPSVGPSQMSRGYRSRGSIADAWEATQSARRDDERATQMKRWTEAALVLAKKSEDLAREQAAIQA